MIAGPSGPAPPCCPVEKSAGDGPPPGHARPFPGVQPLPCFRSLRSLPCPAGIIRAVFRPCERFFTLTHTCPPPRPQKRPVGPFTGRGGIPQLSPSPSSSPRGAALAPSLDFLAPEGSNGRAVWPVLPARRPKAGRLAGGVLAPACGGTFEASARAHTHALFYSFFLFVHARARGLPAKPVLARLTADSEVIQNLPFSGLNVPFSGLNVPFSGRFPHMCLNENLAHFAKCATIF